MLLYCDSVFERHDTGNHPENRLRLAAIESALQHLPPDLLLTRLPPQAVDPADLLRVHRPEYLEQLEQLNRQGGGRLDADTVMSLESLHVAKLAAGSACDAVRQVLSGTDNRALCLIRPPGHHALPDRAMGFCLFSNVAIAARHALNVHGLERVLIVDWDVHHGNGTQDIFYEEERVTFFSMHRDRFWPGSGHRSETGSGAGLGSTFNLPVPFGTPRGEILDQFENTLNAALRRSRPQLILISAGFDAHRLDPIGSLQLEVEDFAMLTQLVRTAATAECDGKIVSLLEGGYHPQMLAESVITHIQELLVP